MDLDGRSWSLSDQTGKIALLFFFGHNATVCEESAPRIQSSVQDRYATRGLLVLGIECWNGTREQVQRFAEHTSVDYPLLLGGRDVASDFGLSYHSFVLVDGRGIVRYVNAGPDDAALDLPGLESAISTLLEEANEAVTSTWGQIKTLYGRKLGLDGIGAQIPGPGPS
jgi:peroxiredoxin